GPAGNGGTRGARRGTADALRLHVESFLDGIVPLLEREDGLGTVRALGGMRIHAGALVRGHQPHVEPPESIRAQMPAWRLVDDSGLREIRAAFGTALKVGSQRPGLLRPGGHQVITFGPG